MSWEHFTPADGDCTVAHLGVKWSQAQICQPDGVMSQDIGIAAELL